MKNGTLVFFLPHAWQRQLAFVVGSRSEVVALPDSVWGPRLEGFSSGSEDEDINSGSSRNKKWMRE